MQSFSVNGSNGYALCEITSDVEPTGQLTVDITVDPGTPAVVAAVFDPGTGAYPASGAVQLRITGPDDTVYDTAANTSGLFVQLVGTATYVVCVDSPAAGRWSMTVSCTQGTTYRADLIALPSSDPVHSALDAAVPQFPDENKESGDQYLTEAFGWTFQCLSVVLAAAAAVPGLQLPPVPLIVAASGLPTEAAELMWPLLGGCAASRAGILLTQQCGYAFADSVTYPLVNGDGSAGLAGWTVLAAGGQGWSVQEGVASAIQYDDNFAVSDGWCRKAQTIDLVGGAGFTAEFLDLAPTIQVSDWLAAAYPTASATPSQYYLLVELRDANQAVLKAFQTGALSLPAADGLDWQRIGCTFADYGPGVRYVYFEHGGLDAEQYAAQYGLKITGAEVDVAVAVPTNPPLELITNGSGQSGTSGWDVSGDAWTVEDGPGLWCPGTQGSTAFAVASGTGTKSQLIDLVAAGYDPTALDAAPVIQFGQWICAEAGCSCTYTLKCELRDAAQNVLGSFDSGSFELPRASVGTAPFRYLAQNLSGYGAGFRYVYFEHSATPASAGMSAKIAGASVQLLLPPAQDDEVQPALDAGETTPTPISDTTAIPYKWVCRLVMQFQGGAASCSGWLIPRPSSNLYVVGSAAHCLKVKDYGWPISVTVIPAANNSGTPPYRWAKVPTGALRVPYNWLVKNQTKVNSGTLYDYAAICVPGPTGWDTKGFIPTVESDAQLKGQAATITGFPAQAPYSDGYMYTEPLTLKAWNATQVSIPTNFTQGSSGGPIYVADNRVVGIVSYGPDFPGGNYLFNSSATRITSDVAADITRWSTPLQPTDRVQKLQFVIRTGTHWGAGTDDDLVCYIDDQKYDLEALWEGGAAGFFRSRNERGDYDGYDLTPRLNKLYPNGIQLQYLLGKHFSISRVIPFFFWHSWLTGDWEVESVAVYVNDQLLCAQNFNQWVIYNVAGGEVTGITGSFTLEQPEVLELEPASL